MNVDELLGSGVFWGAVAALVPLSVAIGSLITLGINAWSKHRNRAEADWSVTMSGYASTHDPYGGVEGIHVSGRVANVGDGAAFRVDLVGTNCKAVLVPATTEGMPTKAFMAPGSWVSFAISMELDQWDAARVDITWTAPPTRLGKQRRYSLTPREYMAVPGVTTTDPDTGNVYQRPVSEVLEELRATG